MISALLYSPKFSYFPIFRKCFCFISKFPQLLFPPFKRSQRRLLSFSWNVYKHLPYLYHKAQSYCWESPFLQSTSFVLLRIKVGSVRTYCSGCCVSLILDYAQQCVKMLWKEEWGGTGQDGRAVPMSVLLKPRPFQWIHCSRMSC